MMKPEEIGHLVISFVRVQEKADRTREESKRLEALPGHESEATLCRMRADALQREADRLFSKYLCLRRSLRHVLSL
jgi:hypothetical protein